jgi:hypothetical protein
MKRQRESSGTSSTEEREKHLLDSLLNLQKTALSINHSPLTHSIEVEIDPDELSKEDLPLIKELFSYFLSDYDTLSIMVNISPPKAYYYQRSIEITRSAFNKQNAQYDQLALLTRNYAILINSVLFRGFLSSLHDNGLPIEISKWCDALRNRIVDSSSFNDNQSFYHYITNVDYLYTLSNNPSILERLLPKLLRESMKWPGAVTTLLPWIEQPSYSAVIKKMDECRFFLHKTAQQEYEAFGELLKIIEKPGHPYDKQGNSLLHLCKEAQYLPQAYKLTPDINHYNNEGDTPLHIAAYQNSMDKACFLLMHNANPAIKNKKGENFWAAIPDNVKRRSSLAIYCHYQQHRSELKVPPKIVPQRGLTCGIYATAFAIDCLRVWHSEFFPKEYVSIPARKGDCTPKAPYSLLQYAKAQGITVQGPIFRTKDKGIVELIEATGCNSLVYDINNFSHFMRVIEKATKQKLPIIIPFAWEINESAKINRLARYPRGHQAHWATIIDLDDPGRNIALAQWGRLYTQNAKNLFCDFNFYL